MGLFIGNKLVSPAKIVNTGGGGGYSELPNYQVVNGVLSKRSGALTDNEFSNVTSVSNYGLEYAFYDCSELTGSLDLSSLTTVGDYGLKYAFYGCSGLTSVNLSALTTVGGYGLERAFYDCSGLTSVNLSALTSIGENGLKLTFCGCSGLTSVNLSALTSIGYGGIRSAFRLCENLTVLSFPALSSVNISNDSFSLMLDSCTDVTVHFPFDLESTMSSWSSVTSGFGGTNTTVLFDLNGCELTFAITPTTGNRLIVNGDELSSNSALVAKSSTASYQIYNSSYGLYISEYLAPDADSATVTVDITTPTYYTISLNTSVSGLIATINVDGISYPLTETGNTGVYTINLYKTLSGSVSVNYLVSGGGSYADASGTLTFNNSDISETITMQPAQDIAFTRPDLTENGTMGGDSFAVKSGTLTSAYRAVDSSSTTNANISSSSSYTFEFYNPEALKVSQLTFLFSVENNGMTGVTIEGSNDDTNWTQVSSWSGESSTNLTVDVNSSAYYKYHKLTMTPVSSGKSIRFCDLGITAVYKG